MRLRFTVLLLTSIALGLSAFAALSPVLAEGDLNSIARHRAPGGVVGGDPIDLSTGIYIRSRDDIILQSNPPISFRRTYINRDIRSRAFGVGATHLYDWFIIGDSVAFTWAAIVLEDGGRIQYNRISPGRGHEDAVYEHTTTPTAFYKSTLRWMAPGWVVRLLDGTEYAFQACAGPNVRPGHCGLVGYRNRQGKALTITRDIAGNATAISASDGHSISLKYDSSHRIVHARSSFGRILHYVDYAYDGSGRLVTVRAQHINLLGPVLMAWAWMLGTPLPRWWHEETSTYSYDEFHNMVTIREPGIGLDNEYDRGARTVKQNWLGVGTFIVRYQLDTRGRIMATELTQPDGTVRKLSFNRDGYPLSDVFASGTLDELAITYDREEGTNQVRAVTVTCLSVMERRRHLSAKVQEGQTGDLVVLELLYHCGSRPPRDELVGR